MDGEVLSNERFDVYRSITENIIETIEAGPGVFRMPWHWMGANGGRPINAFTGKPYRGVNVVTLWAAANLRGFDSCHWATYRQWRELGGQERRGEQGSTIVFYKEIEVEPSQGYEGEDGEREQPFLAKLAATDAQHAASRSTSPVSRPSASLIRRPVAAIRPNSVEQVRPRIP